MIVSTQAGLTMSAIRSLVDQLNQQMVLQFQQLGVPEENIRLNNVVTIGENEFYSVDLLYQGQIVQQFIIVNDAAGETYTFTFTEFDPEVVEQIMSSFRFVE